MGKFSEIDIRIEEEADRARMSVGKHRTVESVIRSAENLCFEFSLPLNAEIEMEDEIWSRI